MSTLNNVSIEGDGSPLCTSHKKYKVSSPQASLTEFAFKERSLLAIQKGSLKPSHIRRQNATAKRIGIQKWRKKTARAVNTGSTTSPSRSSRRRSNFSPVLVINASTSSFRGTDTPSLFWTLLSLAATTGEECYDHAHFTLSCPLLSREALLRNATLLEEHPRCKNTGDWQPRPLNRNRRFSNNWCF